jgi:hypothetical protein
VTAVPPARQEPEAPRVLAREIPPQSEPAAAAAPWVVATSTPMVAPTSAAEPEGAARTAVARAKGSEQPAVPGVPADVIRPPMAYRAARTEERDAERVSAAEPGKLAASGGAEALLASPLWMAERRVEVEPSTSAPVPLPSRQPELAAPVEAERPGQEMVGMSALRVTTARGSRLASQRRPRVALAAPVESVLTPWAAPPAVLVEWLAVA